MEIDDEDRREVVRRLRLDAEELSRRPGARLRALALRAAADLLDGDGALAASLGDGE